MAPAVVAAIAAVLVGQFSRPAQAQTPTITVDVGHPAGAMSPTFGGLMTEEINHSYDGGLYAELVRNRSFRDNANTPAGWSPIGGASLVLDHDSPLNPNQPVSLRVDVANASSNAPGGVANAGFWGFPIRPSTTYHATFFAKAAAGFDGPLTLSLQSSDGRTIYAQAQVSGLTASWKKFEADLKTTDSITPTADARYALTIDRPGAVSLSFVSLFPPTYNHRPNGLRQDLMQMLVDLKPKFLRFPGGNYVEGGSFATRFDWKKTIGPVEERPGHPGCWGYRSSDGMGLLEFLEWTQDMGAEPVLAVFAGYTLDKKYVEAGPELQPYVDEALEEIEYVTGGPETTWGRQRAKDGHPEPFKLRYVEIGNEDFFDQSGSYDKRFAQFYDAIKAKHPELKIISTIGNEHPKAIQVASRVPDVVDEHYYRSADEFMRISPTFYEKYSREKRPEIFVGEWASYPDARIKPWTPAAKKLPPTPNMKAALGDACFMAAMERNADLVIMQCYAPLLVNVNAGAWQWGPDLIGYDALRAFGSPSYYAIKMFNTHLGNERLALTHSDTSVQASATRDSERGIIYLKLVNSDSKPATVQIDLKDAAGLQPTAQVLTLSGQSSATNSIDHPKTVVPAESTLNGVSPHFSFTVKPESICVISLSERAPK